MSRGLPSLAVTIVMLSAAVAHAAEAKWTPLFNGKDLAGWKEVGGGKWSVQDGCIVGERGDGRYGWLCTERTYADFVLQLKFKSEQPGNSGVQFRSHVIDGEMYGYQADVSYDTTGWTGDVYEERGRAWLMQAPAEKKAALKVGDWNDYEISMIGTHITVKLDGVTTVDFNDDRTVRGIIALQVHSGDTPVRVRWKDIRIQDLGYSGPAWQPLFNGKDLTGWVNNGQEKWAVEDGAIVGEAVTQAYGYLSTEKTYKDFEVRVEFKCEAAGNSGLFFHSTLEGVNIRGVQAEVNPGGPNTAGLYEAGGRAWLIKPNAEAEKLFIPGDWNYLQVKCVGNRTITHLNGWLAVDYTDAEPKFTDGCIALQLHSGGGAKVRWRELYIREMKAP